MKALCWNGKRKVEIEDVAEPRILNPRDAIVRVTRSAICGSDLHLYDGYIPTMQKGDILGHEFMGEVMETGPGVKNLKPGDRVVVPFGIACGNCFFCRRGLWSACDNSNPNAWITEKLYGYPAAALFGYSHMLGGYAGGQAQFVRVPFADVGPIQIESDLPDDKLLLLTDIFPTGYMAAENCEIQPGDTVAVWGCGPVGQLAMLSARLLGAVRVIAIDRVPARLRMAREHSQAEVLNYQEEPDVVEALKQRTAGLGPDAVIDAVGMEAHSDTLAGTVDKIKQKLRLSFDRPSVLRQVVQACRKGGTVSVPGAYGGFVDMFPFGAVFGKGLKIRTGQTHVHHYLRPLLEKVERGEVDPSFIITHRLPLAEAPRAYAMFAAKQDDCIKAVLDPWAEAAAA